MFLLSRTIKSSVSPRISASVSRMMSHAPSSKSLVTEISGLKEFQLFITSNKLLLVDFYATWCGPCKMLEPMLDKLAERVPEVAFCRVDVDKVQDVAREYTVTAMPTIIAFKNGEIDEKIIGVNPPKITLLILSLVGSDISKR